MKIKTEVVDVIINIMVNVKMKTVKKGFFAFGKCVMAPFKKVKTAGVDGVMAASSHQNLVEKLQAQRKGNNYLV